MNDIAFVQVGGANQAAAATLPFGEVVQLATAVAMEKGLGLWCSAAGTLQVKPFPSTKKSRVRTMKRTAPSSRNGRALVFIVKCVAVEGSLEWYAVPTSDSVGINGLARPLPLIRLEPGSLFSVGQRFWWVTGVRKLDPQPAPPEIADTLCPICGCKLSVAPVVQCLGQNCGRWTHLERPDEPSSEEALNCYLIADKCGDCLHPTTLDPVLSPEPPAQLFAPYDDDFSDFEVAG
jgi:hypothetical protein